jgi:hypothetical protein
VVVASSSYEQHLDHLQQLFRHLQTHRLVINLVKFVFAASKMEFLCHEISAASVKPIGSHKEAFGSLFSAQHLQAAAGVPRPGELLSPFSAWCCQDSQAYDRRSPWQPGANKPVPWTSIMQQAFQVAKQAVSAVSSLAHPVQGANLHLVGEASATHLRATLQKQFAHSAAWKPLGFFFRNLELAQVPYWAFDYELLTCFLGKRHFLSHPP